MTTSYPEPQPGAQQGPPQHGVPQQHWHQQSPPQPSGTGAGLDPKVGGLLAYVTWVGGLAMYLTQKHPEVRFHAAQSILFNISLLALWIVLWTAEFILTWVFSGFGLLTFVLFRLVSLGMFVLWIILATRGYNLVHFKLPVIGDTAEKWAAK